jgi:iron complex transport system substrate-binding protein
MKPTHLLAAILSLAILAAACGDDSSDTAAATDTDTATATDTDSDTAEGDTDPAAAATSADFPVTIESAGGTWTLDDAPQRIVSLSPMATEVMFAIGAGDQIVAADAFSNYPPEAPTTELSGWDPNVEAIVAYEPDLVVAQNDANDMVAGLTALGIPVLISPAPLDLEQGYDEMAALGLATGHVDGTAEVISTLRAELDAVFASAPDVPVRIYHELDENYFSASSNSFIGAVYTAMGTENVADPADEDGFGFPQLTEEYIVEADPQVIVITDQVSYGPDEVAARPGWGEVSAVQTGNVVVVSADAASRWGPRLPQFAKAVADALAEVEAGVDA